MITPRSPLCLLTLRLMAGVCVPVYGMMLAAAPIAAAEAIDGSGEREADHSLSTQTSQDARDGQNDPGTDFGTDTGGGEPSGPLADDGNEIVVSGIRLRGQLNVDQAPLLELGEEEIAAEGVASIADLVTQITNQTGSARGRGGGGRPVILVNGIRTGSFRELFQYPPEALARVEVFPEEVAQRFGFPPDQRVINLILKENYASNEVEFEFEGPARGGNYTREQEYGYLRIADGARINVNLTAQDTSLLTEAERGIIQTPGSISELANDPDQALFRSLVPDSRNLEGNVSWSKAFLESGISLSANANYQRDESRSLDGLNIVTLTDAQGQSLLRTFGEEDPLERRVFADTAAFSGSLTAPVNAFRLTSTIDASLAETTTEVDQRFDTSALELAALDGALAIEGSLPRTADAGFETARARTWQADNLNTLRGPIASLPAGEVLATFDLGYSWNRIESADTRTSADTRLTRGTISTGANLVVPLTSRRAGVADALGSFSLNLQAGLEELSDFGTLGDYNASLNWQPTDSLELSATFVLREVAPTLANLGAPQISNFNVPIFDFTTGETVLATVTTGGNPDLPAETQRDWKFAANWELPFIDNTRFTVEYIRNRSDDVVSAFPQITQAIEDAFPDRITRDASGQLIALDRRAVSFAETRADRIQFIISTRGSFGDSASGRGGGGEDRGRGRPPGSNEQGAARPAGRPPEAGGEAPAGEAGDRRAAFLSFRERVCGEDGLAQMRALVSRIEAGEDISELIPGANTEFIKFALDRARAADGSIPDEALERFRSRICSAEAPSATDRGSDEGVREGRQVQSGGSSPPAFNPLARGRRDGWRYFANLTHTIELQNEILIAPGVPVLDQLDGDATGQFGLARHSSRLEAGIFGNGIGMRLSGRYTGPARLNGSDMAGSSDLFFGDLATFDVRVFTNIDQLTGSSNPLLKNLRVSFRLDNAFDAQLAVRDENGKTPINYQPFLIDPVGRFIGVDIRKLF